MQTEFENSRTSLLQVFLCNKRLHFLPVSFPGASCIRTPDYWLRGPRLKSTEIGLLNTFVRMDFSKFVHFKKQQQQPLQSLAVANLCHLSACQSPYKISDLRPQIGDFVSTIMIISLARTGGKTSRSATALSTIATRCSLEPVARRASGA